MSNERIGPAATTLARDLKRAARSRTAGLLVATGVALLAISIKVPSYVSLGNLQLVALQVTTVGIVAVGTTLLIIGGNVDLSVGSMTGMIATASALLSQSIPEPWPLVLGVLIGAFCGLVNGYLVWRIRISPIIITVGSLSVIYSIGLVLNHGTAVLAPASFGKLGSVNVLGFSLSFAVFVVLSILGWVFLSITRAGRQLYAVGGNREAALRVGIPVRRIVLGTFVVNGLLAGLGAVLLASRFGTGDPNFGLNLEIQVLTAVILGGVAFGGGEGTMAGVFVAVVFLGVLESGIVAAGVSEYWSGVVEGGTLIIAVALQQLAREQHARRLRARALAEAAVEDQESQPAVGAA